MLSKQQMDKTLKISIDEKREREKKERQLQGVLRYTQTQKTVFCIRIKRFQNLVKFIRLVSLSRPTMKRDSLCFMNALKRNYYGIKLNVLHPILFSFRFI